MISKKNVQLKSMDRGVSAFMNTLLCGSNLEKKEAKSQLPCYDCPLNENHYFPLCFEILTTGGCPPQCLVLITDKYSFGKIAKVLYSELMSNSKLKSIVFIKDSHLNISSADIGRLMDINRIVVIVDLDPRTSRETWIKQLEDIPVKVVDLINQFEVTLEEGK